MYEIVREQIKDILKMWFIQFCLKLFPLCTPAIWFSHPNKGVSNMHCTSHIYRVNSGLHTIHIRRGECYTAWTIQYSLAGFFTSRLPSNLAFLPANRSARSFPQSLSRIPCFSPLPSPKLRGHSRVSPAHRCSAIPGFVFSQAFLESIFHNLQPSQLH